MDYRNILNIDNRAAFRARLTANGAAEPECWVALKRGRSVDDEHFWYPDAVETTSPLPWRRWTHTSQKTDTKTISRTRGCTMKYIFQTPARSRRRSGRRSSGIRLSVVSGIFGLRRLPRPCPQTGAGILFVRRQGKQDETSRDAPCRGEHAQALRCLRRAGHRDNV